MLRPIRPKGLQQLCAALALLATTACESPTAPTGPQTELVDEYRADGISDDRERAIPRGP